MSGKRGRSGRKKGSGAMSAVEHAARGTYRPGVHGPLPPGVIPVPFIRRPALVPRGAAVPIAGPPAVPLVVLTGADAPAVLTEVGRAFWGVLVGRRPVDVMHAQILTVYVQAWEEWGQATRAIAESEDVAGQTVQLGRRRDAEAALYRALAFLGWRQSVVAEHLAAATPPVPAPSKLGLFLASRGKK